MSPDPSTTAMVTSPLLTSENAAALTSSSSSAATMVANSDMAMASVSVDSMDITNASMVGDAVGSDPALSFSHSSSTSSSFSSSSASSSSSQSSSISSSSLSSSIPSVSASSTSSSSSTPSTSTSSSASSSSSSSLTTSGSRKRAAFPSSAPPPPAPPIWKARSINDYRRDKNMTLIGEGTYGSVFLARSEEGEMVALKKIRKEKKEGFPITAIREIKILKRVQHANIVRLKDVVSSHSYSLPPNANTATDLPNSLYSHATFKEGDVFMVFEFMDHDLTGLMEAKIPFSSAQIKYYIICILEGLFYLHRCKIMHRDIKGANILVSNDGRVKIADFGLARIMTKQAGYTNRVVTLWYRAPELLLGMSEYDTAIDLWALGCLFAELLTGGDVLFPGNNTDLDQLNRIYEHCGTPNEQNWPGVTKLRYYKQFEPKPRERTLTQLFEKKASRTAVDLLDKLLTLDPTKRITAKDALDHPYFTEDPRPMRPNEHPQYLQNCHEYHSKRRRRGREMEGNAANPPANPPNPVAYVPPHNPHNAHNSHAHNPHAHSHPHPNARMPTTQPPFHSHGQYNRQNPSYPASTSNPYRSYPSNRDSRDNRDNRDGNRNDRMDRNDRNDRQDRNPSFTRHHQSSNPQTSSSSNAPPSENSSRQPQNQNTSAIGASFYQARRSWKPKQ